LWKGVCEKWQKPGKGRGDVRARKGVAPGAHEINKGFKAPFFRRG